MSKTVIVNSNAGYELMSARKAKALQKKESEVEIYHSFAEFLERIRNFDQDYVGMALVAVGSAIENTSGINIRDLWG